MWWQGGYILEPAARWVPARSCSSGYHSRPPEMELVWKNELHLGGRKKELGLGGRKEELGWRKGDIASTKARAGATTPAAGVPILIANEEQAEQPMGDCRMPVGGSTLSASAGDGAVLVLQWSGREDVPVPAPAYRRRPSRQSLLCLDGSMMMRQGG